MKRGPVAYCDVCVRLTPILPVDASVPTRDIVCGICRFVIAAVGESEISDDDERTMLGWEKRDLDGRERKTELLGV